MKPKIFDSHNETDFRYTACLNYGLDAYPFVRGYKEAADILIQNLSETDGRSIDGLVYPICYLYRHHIEIFIKDIIHVCGYLYDDIEEEANKFLAKRSHSISGLWNKLKEYLIISGEYETEIPEELAQFDHLISELSVFDPSGTAFRYHKDTNGRILLQNPETKEPVRHCDVFALHDEMQKLSKILECVDMDLSVKLDFKLDYIREMQEY